MPKYSKEEIASIKFTQQKAGQILHEEPELAQQIVDEYRQGDGQAEIANRYILDNYSITSLAVAVNIVKLLVKHQTTEEERTRLRQIHFRERGLREAEKGTGAHGIDPETGEKYTIRGGETTYQRKTGIFGMNKKEREIANSKGGRKSAKARLEKYGTITGTAYNNFSAETGMTEEEFILFRANLPENRSPTGRFKNKNLAEQANMFYNNKRKPKHIRSFLSKRKGSI
jgi:hypothetical protein